MLLHLRHWLLLCLPALLLACGEKNDEPQPASGDTFPEHTDYRIYVVDNTGWDALALYSWGTVNDLTGKWPGKTSDGTLTVSGQRYAWFSVPVEDAYGCAQQLIFNNNNGGKQLADTPLTFGDDADYFFSITGSGATALSIKTGYKVDHDTGPIDATATVVATLSPVGNVFYNIYQVNPKLYGGSGAFQAIKGRLDAIASLGTEVLYLMPVYPQGKVKSVGSPYCISDFKGVNSSYGNLDDLRSLVNAAHEKGMKVMFDWVANHTAWDCAWVSEHPDWYKKDASGNIVCPTADGTWSDVAQLDYSNRELWAAMTEAMVYWLSELDIDGYRCDYAHGPTGSRSGDFDLFWQSVIGELKAIKPDFLMLAESDFSKLFDDGFDINYSRSTRSKLIEAYGSGKPQGFVTSFASASAACKEGQSKLVFVTNHDEASTASPVQDFRTKEGALGAFLLMRCLPASNLFYGSQEIAYPRAIDFCKNVSIAWDSNADYFNTFRNMLADIDAMRKDASGVFRTSTVRVAGPAVIISFDDGASLAVNTADSQVNVTMPADAVTALPGSFTLEPYAFLIVR